MIGALMILFAALSEIKVDLKLDAYDFVVGEKVRGIVDIANSSPDHIGVGKKGDKDYFFIELFRASDMHQFDRVWKRAFVAAFSVESGEGQKLETFLGDHFAMSETSRYLAKPVLVHNGVRYEGQPRAFDIVEGIKAASAMQMFVAKPNLQRNFELVYWSRGKTEHLFLKANDSGTDRRRWETRDLGSILRIDKPTISVLESGEVIVLHRSERDWFRRSVFWSLPKALEFRSGENVQDPETAGTQRVRELYKKSGVKPTLNPWWKFW